MGDASEWVPRGRALRTLESAARRCQGCELWEDATQVVFGSGSRKASLMLVGEQPGDQEDRGGEPFVGPAGRVLHLAMDEAGIPPEDAYLTNAVKHFRHQTRGKRRIHQKPDLRHLVACEPWLEAELESVDPDVVVALGATAGRAVLGRTVRIGAERGEPLAGTDDRVVVLTTHPSAVLRLRGKDGYAEAFAGLVDDLGVALRAGSGGTGTVNT
ncbi:MAG: UdgX family uracil-DNA binding protein [Nocardioides sp.]